MKFRPRGAEHLVSAVVLDSPLLPVPFAEAGTLMSVTRVRAEWRRLGTDPWRLMLLTVWGAANNGSHVMVDYFPDNPDKQPPTEFSEWITSTHPEHASEESKA